MRRLVMMMILISIAVNGVGCGKQDNEVETLSNELQEKDKQIEILNDRIIELEKELSLSKEQSRLSEEDYKERIERLDKLFNKLSKINSLEEIIDEYLCELDGAYAEGYGYRLYELYFKEGIEEFISILSRKDTSIIEGVTASLFEELSIQQNVKEIDEIIDYLENVKLDDIDNKGRYVIYSIFAAAYHVKIAKIVE